MPRLSVKAKILITVLIPSIRPGLVIIITLNLYIILRIALIYLTLILIIYFVT